VLFYIIGKLLGQKSMIDSIMLNKININKAEESSIMGELVKFKIKCDA
jgi:hypothetical protein